MNIIVFREWFSHKLYPLLFSLCIVVSLGAFLSLDALQQSVNEYIDDNQKQIVGGDIVITNNQTWSEDLLSAIDKLKPSNVVYDYQFNAIAYNQDHSILTRIKAVSSAYPLYGELSLVNNTGNTGTWQQGSVLVEQQVLHSLNVAIGDTIQVGEAQFIIHDEILAEPDRPLTAFGFGARIIMHDTDLEKTQLMGNKSRINYRIEIRQDHSSSPELKLKLITKLITELKQITKNSDISIKTADESNSSIANLSQNFLVFLKLLVVAVILLSAIGIMSIIKAFVSKQQNTNAIRAAVGEKSITIINSYRLLFVFMALSSVILAWLVSLMVLYFSGDVFAAILPNNIDLSIGWVSIFKAAAVALVVTALMAHFSLNSIHSIKPVAVLHKHPSKLGLSQVPWLWVLLAGFALFALLYSELGSSKQSLQVFFGLIVIWFVFALTTKLLMKIIQWCLTKNLFKNWMLVLALQNIFRKGNQSSLFITALSMTTMVLGSIAILDHSIQQQLIDTYPDDAPNFFLLDVQTEQQHALDAMFAESLTYYPVIRARIVSVNGIKTAVLKTKLGRYDNINRVFNLSYAEHLLPTEKILRSKHPEQLFSKFDDEVIDEVKPLSILSSFAEFLQVGLGDKVTFNVQGIKITTQITSIRKRLKRGPSPFFYFIFPPEVMADAPQIRFATAKVADDKRIDMQTKIAKTFPGITTLDGGSIAKKLKSFVDQLKGLVQIFTALSLFAGLLIFATSLLATSQDRLRESFYYRMMGMLGKDLFKLATIEFLALGLFAFNLGVVIAATVSFLITKYWFALGFIFPWSIFISANLILILVLLIISSAYSNFVKKSKVITFLRYENS